MACELLLHKDVKKTKKERKWLENTATNATTRNGGKCGVWEKQCVWNRETEGEEGSDDTGTRPYWPLVTPK